MKHTGATKDGELTIQQLFDKANYAESYQDRVDARVRIVEMIDERERLRAAIQKFVDAYSDGKESRLGNGQARRSLDEFRRLLNDNDATPGTSVGKGEGG